ncbi:MULTISPECIES: PAS domain S-box protein [unclassified Polynucleobacter]|uniref:PAS domain-containing sensor histidine kinase n=1 Tax=unclassified Polynucleobacter TaxID=2640945 RepID=UPI001F301F84|nr:MULTISPECIES: PAS domain S-box protein [unclassified Polynucleobacter]MCE7527178.1 PAS domain S-box protein [Polynucleobacter sp. IMCC 30228]MCE7528965.1 PAS domain S-box protein [Polynucleobacter sp. IMCC 29146]
MRSLKQLFTAKLFNRNLLTKLRASRIVFTPLLAIIIFTLAMGIILGTLQMQERSQQENALFRELSFVKQRIQLRFLTNSEALVAMSQELGKANTDNNAQVKVLKQAEAFVANNHEISQLIWFNENNLRQWMIPLPSQATDWFDQSPNAETIERQLKRAIILSRETNRPAYSEIISLQSNTDQPIPLERQTVFWQTVPTTIEGEGAGILAVLYSAHGILEYIIPTELKSQYRFTLLNYSGNVLAISSDRNTPTRALSNETSLELGAFSPTLILKVDTYPPPTNLTFRMLLGVVIGLSAFVIWSLWSVLKQIQARNKIETNLRAETSFRSAMEDSTPIGIRAHDMEKRITYVNRAFCEMVGYSSEELIGLVPPFPFWPADKHDQLGTNMERVLQEQNHQLMKAGIEGELQRRNGVRINTRTYAAPLLNEKGLQTGWVTSITDISEPKKIREELTATQERFVTVLEGLDAAVSVVSLETGKLLFANRFYRQRFGPTEKGHISLNADEMSPHVIHDMKDDSVDVFAGLPESEFNQNTGSDSHEVQLMDGEPSWYEVRGRYIPWVDGHLAQLLIATDITLRKQAEDLARQQDERMQFTSRLTTMGEMASSLAHELNQPLSAISNYCMGVAKRLKTYSDSSLIAELMPALEKASAQALRAGTIIQRIRDFVKRSEPQRKSCDIAQIIGNAVDLLEIEANRHRFSIVAEIMPNLPRIELDPVLIEQVLVNLLKNALDSLRDAYPLPSRWSAPPVKITADLDPETYPTALRIQVTDAGSGIADAVIQRMFEPFFSTKDDGMGMGLNICRSIIESHHGRLWAKNQLDPEHTRLFGCTFTILLPIELSENLSENHDDPKQYPENQSS